MFSASEWARSTGTRTQVAVMRRLSSWKIFRVSFSIFTSSSQYPLSVMAELCGNRLKA